MSIWLYIILLITITILINVRVTLNASYNAVGNIGHIEVSILFVKLFSRYFNIYSSIFKPNTNTDNPIKIKISYRKRGLALFKDIFNSIISKIYISRLIINTTIGYQDNSMISTLASGIISSTYASMHSYILARNLDTFLTTNNRIVYVNNIARIDVNSIVYFSLHDIIFATIVAIHKRSMYAKKYR